jgi:hypothetical protein
MKGEKHMKKGLLTLAALSVFTIAACSSTEPATNENIADLKAAFKSEEEKSELGYKITGNLLYSVKDGANLLHDFAIKNLDADLSVSGLKEGEDLKAYASAKYTELKVVTYDEETHAEDFALKTKNSEKHSATAYLAENNLYVDFSNIGIDSVKVDGKTEALENKKLYFTNVVESEASSSMMGMVSLEGLGMSEAEIDEYVYKGLFQFKKSGDSTEAIASFDQKKLKTIFTTKAMADFYAGEMKSLPEANRSDALVAKKNAIEQAFDALIPSLDVDLSFKYNSKGMTNMGLKAKGVFDLSGLLNALGAEAEGNLRIDFDFNLNLKVTAASFPSNFNTAGYVSGDQYLAS